MSLSTRQRYCLEQMGYTLWRSRDGEPEESAQLHWLTEQPGEQLQLVMLCSAESPLPAGQWLRDLLQGLRVEMSQAAWCQHEDAFAEHSPRWVFTLPESWPAPAAKRALWAQAQAQFAKS